MDLSTIVVVNTIVLAIVSLTLLVTRLTLGAAAAGSGVFVAGTALIGLANTGALVDAHTIVGGWIDAAVWHWLPPATLPGALVIAGACCHLRALQCAAARVLPWWRVGLDAFGAGAVTLLLLMALDDRMARVRLVSLLLMLLSLRMLPVAWQLARRFWGARIVVLLLAAIVAVTLGRAAGAMPALADSGDLAAHFVGQLAVLLTLSLGFLVLVQEQVRQQLAETSRTDPLTGLLNRRGLLELLQRDLDRARRLQRPLSLALFDIDHFKRINDTRGHAAGDVVLRAVGNCLLRQSRRSDLAARWGGEEFVVVMPETALTEAAAVAERVRRDIRNGVLPGSGGASITLSGGVVEADLRLEGQAAIDRLLQSADRLMYTAKTTRDRVVFGVAAAAP